MKTDNYSKNLVKNTFLLSINKFISPLISFLLLPIYTNNISTDEYGVTDVIQTYVALLVPILLIRLDVGMFRFLVDRRDDKKAISEVITNTVVVAAPLTIIASVIMVFAIVFNVLPFQVATLFYFLSVMVNNMMSPLTRGLGKNGLFAFASVIDVILKLVFGVVFVMVFQMGGFGLLLSLGLATIINNLVCIVGIHSSISIKKELLNKSLRKELIRLSAPIVVDGVSFWVINTSDRTIISLVLGASMNGIYAVANKFSNLIGTITSVFWMSWSEQASVAVNDSGYAGFVSKIFNSYLKICVSIAVCLIAAVPILFQVLVNQDYHEAMLYVPLLILGLLLNAMATFYGPIYLAYKKSKEVAISTAIAALINLVIDLVLIWFVGVWAAVISTIAAYLFILIYRIIDIKKCVKLSYNIRTIVVSTLVLIACIALYYIGNNVAIVVNIALMMTMSMVMNRDLILKAVDSICKKLSRR